MSQVFIIPQDKITVITNRAVFRTYKVLAITIVVFVTLQLLAHRRPSTVLIPTSVTALVLVTMTTLNRGKIKKAYESLEIVLDDQGVEWKSPMLRYRRILYADMTIEELYEGGVNLYDSHYSSFQRKLSGQGLIKIPKEVGDIDVLTATVVQQVAKHNQDHG